MKSAITVSLVPQARGGPFVYWDGLAAAFEEAEKNGFHAVEIFPPSAAAIDREEVRRLCARHGLKVAAVGTGGGWVANKWHLCHADASIREKARHFITEIIEVAAALDAPAILGSMQGRAEGDISREQAIEWLREALGALGAHAARLGQHLIYEPLNRYETNLFNRLAEAAKFLDEAKIENVKLLADLFHMNIEESSIPEAFLSAATRVGHVHFADSNRHAVGFGHTDIAPVIEALRRIGYAGYLSGEILPLPDSHAAAAQTARAFRLHVHA